VAEASKFIEVKCGHCGFLNLIPVSEKLNVREPVKYQRCAKVLVKKHNHLRE